MCDKMTKQSGGKRESKMRRESKKRESKKRQSSKRPHRLRQRCLSELSTAMYVLGSENAHYDTVINSVMYFKEPMLDMEALKERAYLVFANNWKFRASLGKPDKSGRTEWVLHETIQDLDWHVRKTEIPTKSADGKATQDDLHAYIASTYGQPWPVNDRPLWTMETITNLKDAGPFECNGAILVRIHHLLGDGISLIAYFMKLFDDHEELFKPGDQKKKVKKKKEGTSEENQLQRMFHVARIFLGGIAEGLFGPVLPDKDTDTVIKHPNLLKLGDRSIVTSDVVSLEKVKEIKNKVGGTVNDVLVAALAGVMRNYIRTHSDVPTEGLIRSACLVNMRNAAEMKKIMSGDIELSNRFNFLPVSLPVFETDPIERLYISKETCDDIKLSPAPVISYKLNTLLGSLLSNQQLVQTTVDVFNKWSTVFSNVPGPKTKQKVCGVEVEHINVFANSLSATVFAILSYNDHIQLQCVADTTIIKDPQEMVNYFADEIDVLFEATCKEKKLKKRKKQGNMFVYDATIVLSFVAVFLAILMKLFL